MKVIHFSLESLPIFTMQINIIIHYTDKICKIYTYGPLGQSFDLLRKTNKLILFKDRKYDLTNSVKLQFYIRHSNQYLKIQLFFFRLTSVPLCHICNILLSLPFRVSVLLYCGTSMIFKIKSQYLFSPLSDHQFITV